MTALAMADEGADACPTPDLRAAVLAVAEAVGGARTWSASSTMSVASAGPPGAMASGGPTAGASPPGGQRPEAVRVPDVPTVSTAEPRDAAWTRGGEVAPDPRARTASTHPQLALLGVDRGREARLG